MKIFKEKRIVLFMILLVLALVLICSSKVMAANETTGDTTQDTEIYTYDNIEYKIVDNEIVIVDCTKDAVTLNIPAEIDGLKVTKIDNYALSGGNLTSITIPDTVTEIGIDVLSSQPIKTLIIPDSVTKIGSDFCNSCKQLESVKLPKNLTAIEWQTFAGCEKLKSIEIPSKVKTIDYWAIWDCKELTEVTIPASVTSIDQGVFSSCPNLKKVTFLGTGGEINSSAFSNNSKDLVFYVHKNSTAQAWAIDQNYKYSFIKTPTTLESSNSDVSLFLSADETAELKIDELNEDSEAYKELIGKLSNATVYYGYDISVINGEYEGPITITFTFDRGIDEYIEGKEVIVLHKKSNGEIEQFKQVVKDLKITIQTTELSPFLVATGDIKEEESNITQNTNEKDITPKTGTVDIVSYLMPIAIVSALGIILLRKKEIN